MTDAVERYLERQAEPEARLVEVLRGAFETLLVVPAHREDPAFVDDFVDAIDAARGRVLLVVVVNEHDDASTEHVAASEQALERLRGRLSGSRHHEGAGATVGSHAHADVLVVDRVTEGRRVPRRQAVGLARKIGLDLALALFALGRGPRLAHTTDADATLDADYFDVHLEPAEAAGIHPFVHRASGEASIDEATWLHELFLRYWVAGLAFANSPYALHTIGSTLSVSLPHYAAVRGVPRRAAGEDFYLISKLAKVGPIRRFHGGRVSLRARASSRTPFGTGRAVERLHSRDLLLPNPRCFSELAKVVSALDRLADERDVSRLPSLLGDRLPGEAASMLLGVEATGALGRICRDARRRGDRQARLHTWFDAFRTMKFVHALRDGGYSDLPWRDAVAASPFVAAERSDVGHILRVLRRAEQECANTIGPTLHIPTAREGR